MKPDLYDMVFPIVFGIAAIFFLVIGLRGLLIKRPFLISQRWFLSIMFAVFIPTILQFFFLRLPSGFNLINWLNPLIFGFILLVMCYQMRGYTAYAVTDASFREVLIEVLQKLQLPYQENLSLIRLTSLEADLQVSVQGWMGTGQIKVKQRAHRAVLRKIVNQMNEHFRMSSVPTNMITCVFLLIMGGFMVMFAIGVLLIPNAF